LSLEDAAAAARLAIDSLDGPGDRSYGGAVITGAGNHEKVTALVYIVAFAPDKGESVNTPLIAGFPAAGRSRRPCRPGTASCSWSGTSRLGSAGAGTAPPAEQRSDSQADHPEPGVS
jgi:hypothetical protein